MQRLEVSCAVRHIYMSLGAKGLKERDFCQNLRMTNQVLVSISLTQVHNTPTMKSLSS